MATTAGTIKHRHQSVLPVGTSDVDVPQWNDSEVVAGGTSGDAMVRDTTQSDGWGFQPLGAIYAPLASPIFTGPVTISGGQLVFPATQVPSSNPNVLDDYKEGNWTPVIGGDGGTSGQTYSLQVGTYIKIGRLVCAAFDANFSNKGTITGNVNLQGLPFVATNVGSRPWVNPLRFSSLATNWIALYVYVAPNTQTAQLQGNLAAGTNNVGNPVATDLTNSTTFSGCVTYFAAN